MQMIELIWGVEYHHFETVKNLERQRDDFRNMLDLVLAENEQLRKERDELARIILMVEDGSDLPVDEDEWNCIVRICRLAKKVKENE